MFGNDSGRDQGIRASLAATRGQCFQHGENQQVRGLLREFLGQLAESHNKIKAEEMMPESLRYFVITYRMKARKLCKKNMIDALTSL